MNAFVLKMFPMPPITLNFRWVHPLLIKWGTWGSHYEIWRLQFGSLGDTVNTPSLTHGHSYQLVNNLFVAPKYYLTKKKQGWFHQIIIWNDKNMSNYALHVSTTKNNYWNNILKNNKLLQQAKLSLSMWGFRFWFFPNRSHKKKENGWFHHEILRNVKNVWN